MPHSSFADAVADLRKRGRPDLARMIEDGATFEADGFVYRAGQPVLRSAGVALVTKSPEPPEPPAPPPEDEDNEPPPLAARAQQQHTPERSAIQSLIDEAKGMSTAHDDSLASLIAEAGGAP